MALGIFLLVSDGYDECRGVTNVPWMFGAPSYPLTFDSEDIVKKRQPGNFPRRDGMSLVSSIFDFFCGFHLVYDW
jgi:hypothetical protein